MQAKVTVGKLKNGKAAVKNEVVGEMIKGGVTRWWAGFEGCVI